MTDPNPYSTPTTDPTVAPSFPGTLQLATLSQRFLGAVIDGLISFAIIFPLAFFLGFNSAQNGNRPLGGGLVQNLILGVVGFGLFVAIHWKFLNATGQTIGKKVAKTRIVTMAGTKPNMGDLIGKRYAVMNLLGIIPIIGSILSLVNILMIFKKDRRCLHDLIGGTQVVQVYPGEIIA